MWTILGYIAAGIMIFCIGFITGAVYVAYHKVGKEAEEEFSDRFPYESQEYVLGKAETGDKND